MDGFQDLPRHFGRVWRSEKFNGFDILLVVLGGSKLIKKTMKWKEEEFYARAMADSLRRIFLPVCFMLHINSITQIAVVRSILIESDSPC